MTETAQAEEKILNALEVQGISDSPAVKKRVRELLSRSTFETVMGWVFSNQAVFTSTTSPAPAPTWSPAPARTANTPKPSPVIVETSTADQTTARTGGAYEPPDPSISNYIAAYACTYSEKERNGIRAKLKYSHSLALKTGRALFGSADKMSFSCPFCKQPDARCTISPESLRTYFVCSACGFKGDLANYIGRSAGRTGRTAQDFLPAEATAAFLDDDAYPPEWYSEWEQTNPKGMPSEKLVSLTNFLREKLCGILPSN